MTHQAVQAFLAARGKTGTPLVDYVLVGDDKDGGAQSFPVWDVAKLGAAPTAGDITAMNRSEAQIVVDQIPIVQRAIILALIDQLNVIRAALPSPLGAITPAQALAAIRAKAGTL
jgi:hypothetical protein